MSKNCEQQLRKVNELLEVTKQIFPFIAKVDLETEIMEVLQNKTSIKYPFEDNIWSNHLEYYLNFVLEHEREMIKTSLSVKNLLKLFHNKQRTLNLTIPYINNDTIRWYSVTFNFLLENLNEKIVYIILQEPDENSLLNEIVNTYVYNNCDYFTYIDAKNNSYFMFSTSKDGTPVPPLKGNDYDGEVVKYAEEFVVIEDREMVIREMTSKNVLKALDKKGVHFFTAGVMEETGYRRKKVTFHYYDKEKKIIFLSRSDITDIYNQEIEQRKRVEEALDRAYHDFLTGVYNAHGISENLSLILSDKIEFSALLFIDLDNFKKINDVLGHNVGDKVLCSVAEVLKRGIRESDLVGRLGGDEFIVFLRNIKTVDNAKICADRLRKKIEKIYIELNIEIPTSCSIGMVFIPNDGKDYKELLKKADKLLYCSKNKGKNKVTLKT